MKIKNERVIITKENGEKCIIRKNDYVKIYYDFGNKKVDSNGKLIKGTYEIITGTILDIKKDRIILLTTDISRPHYTFEMSVRFNNIISIYNTKLQK